MSNQPSRTIEEFDAEISECLYVMKIDLEDREQDEHYDAGMLSGFRTGKRMVEEGKTPADILDYARQDDQAYVSHGDDGADAWQSGYSTALYWAAGQYDWSEDGIPIFRENNIFGEPVETPKMMKIEVKQFGGVLPKRDAGE